MTGGVDERDFFASENPASSVGKANGFKAAAGT
jgi:hypothetical protein